MKYYFKIINNVIDTSYAFSQDELMILLPDYDLSLDIPYGYVHYIPYTPPIPLKPYEKINLLGYDYIDDKTITDIIEVVPMTVEEKVEKQEKVKTEFYNKTKRYTWVLNEEHCIMLPPFMPPNDGWAYRWDELTQSYINMNITKVEYLHHRLNSNGSN